MFWKYKNAPSMNSWDCNFWIWTKFCGLQLVIYLFFVLAYWALPFKWTWNVLKYGYIFSLSHKVNKCFVMLYGLSHVCWEIARQWDHRNFEYNVTITLQPYLPPSRHFTHGKVHQEFTFALMDFESKSLHLYSNHFVSSYLALAKIIDLLWKMDNILLLLPHVT